MTAQDILADAMRAIPDDLILPVARALQQYAKDRIKTVPTDSQSWQVVDLIGRAADEVLTSAFVPVADRQVPAPVDAK